MKTALVTGGGKGLGEGFVIYLLDKGFLVFAGVRKPLETKLKRHKNLRVIPLDVTKDSSIEYAVKLMSKEIQVLDYLINNAGVNKDTVTNNHKEIVCELSKLDRKTLLTMFDVDTISPLLVLQKCLPLLEKANSFVINISSNRASYHDEFETESGNYGYRSSKIALNMVTFCSVFDLPSQVRTFAVHPGSVKTDMNPEGNDVPYEQAKKIMAITENWKDEYNGRFLRYNGVFYPL